jgi:hypothetical protein
MSAVAVPAGLGRTWPAACPAYTPSGQPLSWEWEEGAVTAWGRPDGDVVAPDSSDDPASPLHSNYSLGVVVAILGIDIKLLTLRTDQK